MEKSEWVCNHDDIKHHEDGVEGMHEEVQCSQSVDSWNRTVKVSDAMSGMEHNLPFLFC